MLVADLRTELGDEAFADAAGEGSMVPVDEIVDRVLDRLGGESAPRPASAATLGA
jgi:hypothetical protein